MADTAVAVTAIVVSGIVGPALAALWTRQRQRDEHQEVLLRELRDVLDESVHSIGRAKRSFERIHGLYMREVPPDSPEASEAFAARRRTMDDVWYAGDRIALRLGAEHPVHLAFLRCMETLEAHLAFARAYEAGRSDEDALREQLEGHRRYDRARQKYVDAARHFVGPRVGSDPPQH